MLGGVIDRFRYVRAGLAAILVFVGGRMLLTGVVEVPTWASLAVIVGVLALVARPGPAGPLPQLPAEP